jgi:hypothetical protein
VHDVLGLHMPRRLGRRPHVDLHVARVPAQATARVVVRERALRDLRVWGRRREGECHLEKDDSACLGRTVFVQCLGLSARPVRFGRQMPFARVKRVNTYLCNINVSLHDQFSCHRCVTYNNGKRSR